MMRGVLVALLVVVCVDCGGATEQGPAPTGDAGAVSYVDAGSAALRGADATPSSDGSMDYPTEAATEAAATDASGTGCQNSNPPAGTAFLQSSSMCSLPDGGVGVGRGAYGCVDPTACQCKPQAGDAACIPMQLHPSDPYAMGLCVYASCNGANQDERCKLPNGMTGSCCKETCQNLDTMTDANNCGGCDLACPQGMACISGSCGSTGMIGCTGVACLAGRVCAEGLCPGTPCAACVVAGCGDQPDGTPCAVYAGARTGGMCCNHACVEPQTDSRNCGGCGIACCSGTQCNADGYAIDAVCL